MQQQKENEMTWGQGFGIVFWLCLIHQRCLIIPMRNRFGVQALALPCFLATVLMFLVAGFTGDPFMWAWFGIWFLCFVRRRWEAVRLNCSGARVHSHYDGFPFDAARYGCSESVAKLVVEPVMVGVAGGLVYFGYAHMGWPVYGLPRFLLIGCFTLPFVEAVKQTIWKKREQDILDARIEQESTMRDFRQKYGDF